MSSGLVPDFERYGEDRASYIRNMARRIEFDWYLADWITACGLEPKDLREMTGWSKRKMSELLNGHMRYNKDVVNEAAAAMNIQPFELLIPPEEAMEIRGFRRAVYLAAEKRTEFAPQPPKQDRLRNGSEG